MAIIEMLTFLLGYMPLICFFGALVGGEETVLLLSVLAARDFYPIWIVFVFCFLGILVADSVWFFVGRLKLVTKMKEHKYFKKHSEKARNFIDNKFKGNHFILLFSTKFLYGLRIVTLMFLGRRIKFKEFFMYNSIIAAIWTIVIVSLGWFAGRGVGWLWDTYRNLQLLIIVGIIIIVAFYILKIIVGKIVGKWLEK